MTGFPVRKMQDEDIAYRVSKIPVCKRCGGVPPAHAGTCDLSLMRSGEIWVIHGPEMAADGTTPEQAA